MAFIAQNRERSRFHVFWLTVTSPLWLLMTALFPGRLAGRDADRSPLTGGYFSRTGSNSAARLEPCHAVLTENRRSLCRRTARKAGHVHHRRRARTGPGHAVAGAEGADIVALDVCKPISEFVTYPMPTPEDLAETARQVEATGRRSGPRNHDIRDLPGPTAARRRRDRSSSAGWTSWSPTPESSAGAGFSEMKRGRFDTVIDEPVGNPGAPWAARTGDDRGRQRRVDIIVSSSAGLGKATPGNGALLASKAA